MKRPAVKVLHPVKGRFLVLRHCERSGPRVISRGLFDLVTAEVFRDADAEDHKGRRYTIVEVVETSVPNPHPHGVRMKRYTRDAAARLMDEMRDYAEAHHKAHSAALRAQRDELAAALRNSAAALRYALAGMSPDDPLRPKVGATEEAARAALARLDGGK